MMDAIQALATQVIREFMKLCDIGDESLESLNRSISDIATVVHRVRVEREKGGPLAPLPPSGDVAVIAHRFKRGSPTGTSGASKRSKSSPAPAAQVIDTILQNCVELNSKRAKLGGNSDNKIVKVRQHNSNIREYAGNIAASGFEDAVKKLNDENGHLVCKDIQIRYNESIYWDIIQSRADMLDPMKLRAPKGPSDGSSDAEKEVAKEFSIALGLGVSPPSQQKYRRLWKNLAKWRKSGVDMILFYRTRQFDNFCQKYPEAAKIPLDNMVISMEEKYGCHIKQLEGRVIKAVQGDVTGRIWLRQPLIMERIKVPEEYWNNANNPWLSDAEMSKYQSTPDSFQAADGERGGGNGDNPDQSIFISLVPRHERLVYVCPIVTIHEGDYLGIFSGNIRYSDAFDNKRGVRGPTKNLWLDYSQVTGVLNQMKVSPKCGIENVHLKWELIDISEGMECHQAWRVAVRALRTIRPFEELIRSAHHAEQYLLHQEPANVKYGFLSNE